MDHVKRNLILSIDRLGDGGLEILNLVIPKPDIPPDIAKNYKQVVYGTILDFWHGLLEVWLPYEPSCPSVWWLVE